MAELMRRSVSKVLRSGRIHEALRGLSMVPKGAEFMMRSEVLKRIAT